MAHSHRANILLSALVAYVKCQIFVCVTHTLHGTIVFAYEVVQISLRSIGESRG